MQADSQLKWKAILLLVVISALQLAMVLRGLHHHESVCLLDSASAAGQETLHEHAEEHDSCAWSGFHFSAYTVSFPLLFTFLEITKPAEFSAPVFPAPFTFPYLPSGRGPPALPV